MARLILGILPSNQTNRVLGGGSERTHIATLAAAVYDVACEHPSIEPRMFAGRPDTEDYPPGSLSGLVAQQEEAAAWFRTSKREGDLCVSLNLHSDSGLFRHCGFYGPFAALPISEWLGRALCDAIAPWFGGRVLYADYSRYIFATSMLDGPWLACPVLLECGSHQMAEDVKSVREYSAGIAVALIETLSGFFGLDSMPPLNTSELRQYGAWSLARLDNGETPLDLDAFKLHLEAIGCDPADLRRWGAPV